MNIRISFETLCYIKDIFLAVMVIGATVYNIMQDRRIQALEDEVQKLRKDNDATFEVIDYYGDALDDILDVQNAMIEDYCDLSERIRRKSDGKRKDL